MLLLFLSGILIAEDAMDLSRAIGFSGGMISGSGFSYRKLDHKGGFQINGGLLANNGNGSIMEDESVHDIYYWYPDTSHIYTEYDWDMSVSGSFGYNYYKTLRKAKNSTLYLLAGAALYFRSEKEISRDYQYAQIDSAKYRILYVTDEKIQWVHDGTFNLGAGFGIEYNITDHIRVSVDWPLVFSFSTDSDFQIFMYIPQGGIHYYFK
jgi:hypothetical protein